MLELRIKQGRRHVPIFDLPAALGRARAAREVGDTIDGLIAFLDDLGGDPDLEEGGDDELSGDEKGDPSYAEWHTIPAVHRHSGNIDGKTRTGWRIGEDDEDDDQDSCLASDDDPSRRVSDGLPGDSFDTEKHGDEDDYSA